MAQKRQKQLVGKQPKDDAPPTSASNPFDALDETTGEEADGMSKCRVLFLLV